MLRDPGGGLLNVALLVSCRPHAGDRQGFLEDDLAGEFSQYRHGNQPGGSGQGEVLLMISFLNKYHWIKRVIYKAALWLIHI